MQTSRVLAETVTNDRKQALLWGIVLPNLNKSLVYNSLHSISYLYRCILEAILSQLVAMLLEVC